MTTAAVVQVIAIAMALVLVLRALRGRNLPSATLIRWGAIWLAIIVGLTLLAQYGGLTEAIHLN